VTVTDTTTWRDCRHCNARIRPSALGAHWIDADDYDFCEGIGDSHQPVDIATTT
jgi:hypothetical protein